MCSNIEGTKFIHIQVKTYIPGGRSCSIGMKAERYFGENFFWILGGIPEPGSDKEFEYYIIPSKTMSENTKRQHETWHNTLGRKGQQHNESNVRTVILPPFENAYSWDISRYKNRWDLIEEKLID